jgi:hypothetical protein
VQFYAEKTTSKRLALAANVGFLRQRLGAQGV